MILQELLSLASNTFWINQKLSSRTSVCLLAAHTLQCTPLQIDASYLIPILVLCPNWVSVSNSLQNKFIMLSLLKDSFALKTSISLLYTSQMANNLGFLPLSFYPCYLCSSAVAGGKVCSYPLKSLRARQLLPRQCQHWHNSPALTRLSAEQLCWWAGEFLMPFLPAAGFFPAFEQNLHQTAWPHPGPACWEVCYRGSVATGVAGLAEAWHWYGDKEKCAVQSEHVGVKQSIDKTQWDDRKKYQKNNQTKNISKLGMFSFEWILCLWNRGAL